MTDEMRPVQGEDTYEIERERDATPEPESPAEQR